jgi:hypothetical protein
VHILSLFSLNDGDGLSKYDGQPIVITEKIIDKQIASRKVVLGALEKALAKPREEIFSVAGVERQVAMDLLYRFGRMKNKEIGELMGVDYSTVSPRAEKGSGSGRKRMKNFSG